MFNVLSALLSQVEEEDLAAFTQAIFATCDDDGDGQLNFWDFARKGVGPPHRLVAFVKELFADLGGNIVGLSR